MQIHSQNFISFKAISLNKDETKRTEDLLHSLDNPIQKEQATLELFDIFDEHLQKEAKTKAGSIYHQEDFLQRLYLTFLESLENIKGLTTENLLKILNDEKPNKEEIFEDYRKGIFSIEQKINSSDDKTIESKLSEAKILKPLSAVSQEERAEQLKAVQNLAEPLSEKEQELLSKRASGKTYKQIADEKEVNSTTIYNYIRQAIAKIQLNNNILPKEYELFADEFIKTFDLNLSKKEVINIIINNIELMDTNIDTLNSNINNTSKLLEVDRKDLIQAALKQPQLFCQKPETIDANIETISKLLGIDKKSLTQAALKQPQLFCQKPETINKNIETTAKLLGVDKKIIIQAALKRPELFYLKPETIAKKVNIIKYYKQIQGRNNEQIRFSNNSDKNLYYDILAYLVKTEDKLLRALKQNEIIEHLKSQNKIYNFTIPQNELADEFIEYVHEFSKTNLGEQVFNFIKK